MSAIPRVPPLQAGDHLTVAEFERRFRAMPDLKKAELIEGVVFMPSPVTDTDHGVPHFDLNGFLFLYRVLTPGVRGGDNSTLRLPLGANMPQPDGYLRILPEYGGRAVIGPDGYVVGAPDLIDEIAASSASYGLHEKLRAYQRNGVREYIVWRTQDKAIDWFGLRGGKFKRLALDSNGVLKSKVFPGLWLDAQALVSDDIARAYQIAQAGLASPEHAAFVEKLQKRKHR
jgi:Uma2 family endonuclease